MKRMKKAFVLLTALGLLVGFSGTAFARVAVNHTKSHKVSVGHIKARKVNHKHNKIVLHKTTKAKSAKPMLKHTKTLKSHTL